MNEWKELEIDNLPRDIKLSDSVQDCGYEIEFRMGSTWTNTNHYYWWMILKEIGEQGTQYRYRKPDPKAPSHEEILQRVKKELNIHIDTKVSDMKKDIILHMNKLYDCLESAELPPEATK